MDMEVKKSFVADGTKYRPGDKPPDMDKVKAEHYQRYGMIGPGDGKPVKEAKPAQTKPAEPKEKK